MRRIALAGVAMLAVAACTQTAPGVSRAAEQTVVVPGAIPGTSQQAVVSGEMNTLRVPVQGNTAPRHDLYIRVNGQPAVQGTLVTYGATTLQGYAGTMPVTAVCQSRELAKADRQFDCNITLNNRQTVPMSFRATPTGPQQPVDRS
ncbi:hypothetical protein GXW78_12465 [Roseomonas terrae]|uniref:Lipoprotein n=1 Tax=Neoroseomonas terrae TaxID=424799 RepID=A0ABS5EHP0_9PROT|nr:hypothetical protein [Neoroseomonas terrae]MBR0650480.1 hypothetical protein [Neoroseomonas terrae]